jgi:hypothetical protein
MKKTRLDKHGKISTLLSERGKRTNLTILEALALQGYMTTWEITKAVFKDLKHREPSYRETQSYYSTIRKALMKLLGFEYGAQHGSVRHSTHRKEEFLPLYGLTIKGLMVTMVVSEKARQNWQVWVKNALKEEEIPLEMKRILSLLIEYGASQLLFLKLFVDPNEKLVTSMYNMDAVSAKTFWDACVEKMMLTFEEGRFNPLKNLSSKDRAILMKIYEDPNVQKIREHYLGFLEQQYSEKIQKIKSLRKARALI